MDIGDAIQQIEAATTDELKLKHHIMTSTQSIWRVDVDRHTGRGVSRTFTDFGEAYDYYSSYEQGHYVELGLYTQIGTATRFMHRLPDEDEQ